MVLYPSLQRVVIKREPRSHRFHLFRHTAGSIVHELTSDLKLSQELLAHSHISTTADIYVHGRRESKARKATELLASQFVPGFSEEALSRSRNLFQRWFNEKEKGRKRFSDLTSDPILVGGCGGGI
jgi:integrase-like protein